MIIFPDISSSAYNVLGSSWEVERAPVYRPTNIESGVAKMSMPTVRQVKKSKWVV